MSHLAILFLDGLVCFTSAYVIGSCARTRWGRIVGAGLAGVAGAGCWLISPIGIALWGMPS